LIEIYRKKDNGSAAPLQLIFKEMMAQLTEAETKEFMVVVSSELDVIKDDTEIIMILQIIPRKYWSLVKPTAKMRIENKMILSISYGKSSMEKRFKNGILGAWAVIIIDQFTLREELAETIAYSLKMKVYEYNRYILLHFLKYLPDLFENPQKYGYFVEAMKNVVKYNDTSIKEKLIAFLLSCPENWSGAILKGFEDWTDQKEPEAYLPDGTPFLGKVPYQKLAERSEIETDEFPF
jgi:hypothetical protein